MIRKIQTVFQAGNAANLLVVSAALLMLTACVFNSGREPEKTEAKSTEFPPQNASSPSAAEKPEFQVNKKKEDKGDFVVEQPALSSSRFADLDQKIKREKLLEKAADKLNKALSLPEDIFLHLKDCGEANAEFDPNTQVITLCYELMEHFYDLYRSDGLDAVKADEKMFDAGRFVFLHEVGHALIYNYKLPIMGNEEDAADRCSSYINIEELGEDGVKSVLAAADAFRIESRQKSPTGRDYADGHLLHKQRFYNSLCMIYGSNADKYEYFVVDGYLPRQRAERCPSEYQKTVESWVSLLEPWRKDK